MKILITGGAGFVGSNLALKLKEKYSNYEILVIDNLVRRGSELNLPFLKKSGVQFIHADIRLESDLTELPAIDVVIDAAADPSVLSGISSSAVKLIQSNLSGTVNLLEFAHSKRAKFLFLSTSRVYPIGLLNQIKLEESNSRFILANDQKLPGITANGISETFPLTGARSFYGAAKLSAELLIQEYADLKGLEATIFRCGVIAGPGQFGKVDQGVLVFWLASHFWKKKLAYIGYGGLGKQVRDILHIEDLFSLVDFQIHHFETHSGKTYNAGGGEKNSISLQELTLLCENVTGNKIPIDSIGETRVADIPYYVTDNSLVSRETGWSPKKDNSMLLSDTFNWLKENERQLKDILS